MLNMLNRIQELYIANECSNIFANLEKLRFYILPLSNFDLTEASYKVGRSTQLDFLDASLKLRSAKNDYLQAIVDWNKAYNALLQATGEY